ncbi:MAG: glycosyltransferase family 4 protein [bacterium]|nr:glycosyltransferase family 4 protein [bacterium]
MKNKIIFLHPHFLKPGGASKVVLEFASRLKKAGIQNIIITTNIDNAIVNEYKSIQIVNLKWLTTGNIFFWLTFPFFYFKLKKELKKYPSTTPLFCHSLAIYWGAICKLLNKKIILVNYFHDLGMPYTDSTVEINGLPFFSRIIARITLPIFEYFNYKIINTADYLIANSQTSANFIKKKYGRKIDLVACPGVDIDIFKPSITKESYIYTLGRLEKIKNIDLIIKSFALYCKNFEDQKLKLIIIGTGIEKNNLENLTTILGINKRVTFLGSCDQKKVALIASHAKAGIFLCPNESFGLAAVESMACGTPIIGVNSGGIKETVVDGKVGFLVSLDEKEIADKINTTLTDEQNLKILSENARNHAKNNYDWNASARLLCQFFIEI